MPLALQGGAGAELRRPLGIAIIGGLVLSQFLTLYGTPVIYIQLSRLRTIFLSRMSRVLGSSETREIGSSPPG